eukprot:scaffold228013_cov17-Tisochrysis_lutea.AAC.1
MATNIPHLELLPPEAAIAVCGAGCAACMLCVCFVLVVPLLFTGVRTFVHVHWGKLTGSQGVTSIQYSLFRAGLFSATV